MTHRAWKWRRRRQPLRVPLSTVVGNPEPIFVAYASGKLGVKWHGDENFHDRCHQAWYGLFHRSSRLRQCTPTVNKLLWLDRRRRSGEHKRNRKENCWGWRRTNEWMKSPQMKFYKLSLTQQRNSFYASNVPRFTFLRVSFFLSPLRPFVNNKHTNTDAFVATCEGTRNSASCDPHTAWKYVGRGDWLSVVWLALWRAS